MRIEYPLMAFYEALAAWEEHERSYRKSLEEARQPAPTADMMKNYQQVWIEGFLECKMKYANQNEQRAENS